MFSPPISMLFPVFGAHLRKIEFLYSMQTWKELCDKLAISWLKVAITWANWRLSCHMQGFLQAWRSGIPFPQTLANFPSNALILSLKCSRPLPQTLAETKRFLWGIHSPMIFLLNSGKFLMKTIFGGYMNSKNTYIRGAEPWLFKRELQKLKEFHYLWRVNITLFIYGRY